MPLSIVPSTFDFNKFGLLLSKYSYQAKKNDILAGIVIGIESNYALVDLGLEQICFLPLKEISICQTLDLREFLNINFIGEFSILDITNRQNRIIISLRRIESIYLWNRLRQIDFSNITIYAKIEKSIGKGKLTIYNGLLLFVLNSNIPKYYLRIDRKNIFMPFKFLEVKDYYHVAHISSKLAIFSKVNNNLTIGLIYPGNVISIRDFGVFINILGIKCLLHISEMAQKQNKVTNLNLLYKVGDQLKLKVIYKDTKRGRISVTLASLT